jgi:hypothetical protein
MARESSKSFPSPPELEYSFKQLPTDSTLTYRTLVRKDWVEVFSMQTFDSTSFNNLMIWKVFETLYLTIIELKKES